MFCSKCGSQIDDNASFCKNCGNKIQSTNANVSINNNEKTFVATLLLCIFLGGFGAHRFYTGYTGTAICQLLMAFSIICTPVVAIWVLVDLINIITGKFKTSQGLELTR